MVKAILDDQVLDVPHADLPLHLHTPTDTHTKTTMKLIATLVLSAVVTANADPMSDVMSGIMSGTKDAALKTCEAARFASEEAYKECIAGVEK